MTTTECGSPFEFFLRTGLRLASKSEDAIEFKYNHNHDPANGRFTFAGAGRYIGRRSVSGVLLGSKRSSRTTRPAPGGGSGGGGGASGRFDPPAKAIAKPVLLPRGTVSAVAKSPLAPRASIQIAPSGARSSNNALRHVTRNEYDFGLDSLGRANSIDATLTLVTEFRSRAAQRNAGGADRLKTDDGGHYIALRFNGPRDEFNHFAQDANFNLGVYRVLEGEWHALATSGKRVQIRIEPKFVGASLRPYLLHVSYWVDGVINERDFLNRQKGR